MRTTSITDLLPDSFYPSLLNTLGSVKLPDFVEGNPGAASEAS